MSTSFRPSLGGSDPALFRRGGVYSGARILRRMPKIPWNLLGTRVRVIALCYLPAKAEFRAPVSSPSLAVSGQETLALGED